jgi:hypothetical protein
MHLQKKNQNAGLQMPNNNSLHAASICLQIRTGQLSLCCHIPCLHCPNTAFSKSIYCQDEHIYCQDEHKRSKGVQCTNAMPVAGKITPLRGLGSHKDMHQWYRELVTDSACMPRRPAPHSARRRLPSLNLPFYLARRKGHFVPIWQLSIGSSISDVLARMRSFTRCADSRCGESPATPRN